MRLALPSPTFPSLPSRRRSRRTRALAAGKKALKSGVAVKAARGAARRTRATLAFPLLAFGTVLLFVRKRLRSRREGSLDAAVSAPVAVSQPPRAAADDPSPENPETDLPAAPNGSSKTEEERATAKAAVADAPNEGAPGHQPS